MPERRVVVTRESVIYVCNRCGVGQMMYRMSTGDDGGYCHVCTWCSALDWLDRIYPYEDGGEPARGTTGQE